MPRKPSDKPPKLPAAALKNDIVSLNDRGEVIARLDPKHLGRAFLKHWNGYEGLSAAIRLLYNDPRASSKVKFDILKFVATTVQKASNMEERTDLDKVPTNDLEKLKVNAILRLAVEG